jgi:hypothetical protein
MKIILMRHFVIFLLLFVCFGALHAQFEKSFEFRSLRIDYVHAGNHQSEWFALDELLVEPYWGGSHNNLIDTFNYGQQRVEVRNPETGNLLYSRGYNSLFGEWQTTTEAREINRSFTETVVIPFPLIPVKVSLLSRDKSGEFISRFEMMINPDDYFIKPIHRNRFPVTDIEVNANSSKAVDIVLLPDGYTIHELDKFVSDCRQFAGSLFGFHPYDSLRSRFNIRAVLAPSEDSGVDVPADSVWKNTILSTSFYTFDSERYCMTFDHKSVRDLASNAPYDQIYILTNTDKYGGGGIFNFYSLSSSSNRYSAAILVHEFGHGFAGLGDEYYTSSTAYNDFYNLDIEPWEPNLTTLINFDSKWKHLLDPDTPVPTPSDSMYLNKTGVFEGGGYVAKGIYRPAHDCLMHSFNNNRFCAACEEAIRNMVNFYSE